MKEIIGNLLASPQLLEWGGYLIAGILGGIFNMLKITVSDKVLKGAGREVISGLISKGDSLRDEDGKIDAPNSENLFDEAAYHINKKGREKIRSYLPPSLKWLVKYIWTDITADRAIIFIEGMLKGIKTGRIPDGKNLT